MGMDYGMVDLRRVGIVAQTPATRTTKSEVVFLFTKNNKLEMVQEYPIQENGGACAASGAQITRLQGDASRVVCRRCCVHVPKVLDLVPR